MPVFSQRNSEPAARYHYVVPAKVRSRVLHALRQNMTGANYGYRDLLDEVGEQAVAKYGGLRAPYYEAARTSDHPVIEHFHSCKDDEALDFIEMCFRTRSLGFSNEAEAAVVAINRIFEEEGIGYELTLPKWHDTGKPAYLFGRCRDQRVAIGASADRKERRPDSSRLGRQAGAGGTSRNSAQCRQQRAIESIRGDTQRRLR